MEIIQNPLTMTPLRDTSTSIKQNDLRRLKNDIRVKTLNENQVNELEFLEGELRDEQFRLILS